MQVNVATQGWADGLPFRSGSECVMNDVYNIYRKLAPSFNHTPIENHPKNWNLILALTRAMVVLDEARKQLAQPLAGVDGVADVVESTWEVSATETSLVGAHYRGATLSAGMRIVVPQGIYAVQVMGGLEGSGWQIQKAELPKGAK